MRLHEVCGALLLYYNAHHALPPTVAAIEQVPGAGEVGDMTCPVSHKPYIYIPAGVATAPGSPERVVLYDAEPAHGGMRLGIVILPPTADGPLVAKVIAIMEDKVKGWLPTTQP